MNCYATAPGGSFYSVIAAYYPIWSEHCNIFVTAAPGGSIENIKAVSDKEAELGMGHHSMAMFAAQGKLPYDKEYPGVRSIIGIFPAAIQASTLKDSKVTSMEQFNDIKVGMGNLNSTGNMIMYNFLDEEYGITADTIKSSGGTVSYLADGETSQALGDGAVDVAIIFGVWPKPNVQELEINPGLEVLSFGEEQMADFLSKHPEWAKSVMKAGTYKGQTKDVTTASAIAAIFCHEDADTDVIYNLTKAAWDYHDEAAGGCSEIKNYTRLDLIPSVNAACPLHPGALKYYQEVGVMQ
jgi:TRAP transporter TAXI family solute receptor